ncbi:hypothetical protein BDV24DRAFT_172986 [Aspergillus arachidicola]|uniref:Allantoate permease n=1 Tax=Aspergillus arachidicola TaxID=656916 RepID=A0A5N6YCN4_9EURO|nr:hypothetical protein BDV24DRAFT_172986 [Aspergillus arachidicola]
MADIQADRKGVSSEHEHIDPPEKSQHLAGVDAETAAYATGPPVEIDKATDRRLFWKVNKRILVCMVGTYFCQALDKGTLGFSSIMGIQEDAGLDSNKYNWLGTILYIGVLVGEYPTNVLAQKLPVAKYLAANVFLWGVVIACSAAATNFPGLMVVRFLLGCFESCVQPIFIQMTSMWYTRKEQPILTSLWNCRGIMAWGTSHYIGHAIKSWQLLFLVLGVATCVWAVFLGWYLPDSPMKAKCFTEDDKRLLVERVRANETGIQNKTFKRYQLVEALTDPIIWLYVLMQVSSTLVLGGLGVFSNIIIKSFGFTTLQTQLLNIAQGAVTSAVMVGGASLSSWTDQTILVMHLWTMVGLLIAFYCTQFIWAEGNLLFSMISRNVAGQTKKSTVLAMTFIAWAAGNATAPQIFQSSDAPRYTKGFTAHFCLYGIMNGTLLVTRWLLIRRNEGKRDATSVAVAENGSPEDIGHSGAFLDMTDVENPDFRFDGSEGVYA